MTTAWIQKEPLVNQLLGFEVASCQEENYNRALIMKRVKGGSEGDRASDLPLNNISFDAITSYLTQVSFSSPKLQTRVHKPLAPLSHFGTPSETSRSEIEMCHPQSNPTMF